MLTFFGGVSWCYGTIVGSLFRGRSRIFLTRRGVGDAPLRNGAVTDWWRDVPNYHFYGVSHKFFNLVSCFTSALINHIVFFEHVISGGGGGIRTPCTLPQDPLLLLFWYGYCLVSYQTFVLRHFLIWPVRNPRKVPFLAKLLLFRTSGPKRHTITEIYEHLSLLLDWTRL